MTQNRIDEFEEMYENAMDWEEVWDGENEYVTCAVSREHAIELMQKAYEMGRNDAK